MSRRAFTCLLALAGCNQIYGLSGTKERDADTTMIDGAPGTVQLLYLFATPAVDASQGTIATAPISPDPKVKVGLIGAPLEAATYEAGTIKYPPNFVGQTWRLEYTPPGDIPHEVQWSPPDGGGRLAVPLLGRTDRTQAPPNTGFAAQMGAHTFNIAQMYTTGYWTETVVNGPSPSIDFSLAPTMSGPRALPDTNDIVMVVDYTANTSCTYASAIGTSTVPALQSGTQAMATLAQNTDNHNEILGMDHNTSLLDPASGHARLDTALGGGDTRSRSDREFARAFFGRTAHLEMPLFTRQIDRVPAPVLVQIAYCNLAYGAPSVTVPVHPRGSGRNEFPEVMFAYSANDRDTDGTTLRSSIAAVATENVSDNWTTDFPVLIATTPRLGTHDIDKGSDDQLIETAAMPLTFDLELPAGSTRTADYYEATLHHLVGGTFVPVRVYIGPDPTKRSITFDPSVMTPGDIYVFSISTYVGRPAAHNFDFVPVASPQAVATVFTRTFKR